jgi:hypothetical protein
MAFIIYTSYHVGVTNFGDYRSIEFVPWYATAKHILLVEALMGFGF